MVVNKEEIKIVLAGEIENWDDGGEIGGGGASFTENLEDGYFTYDGVKYNVVKMKDGKWWMAQNLAYLPEGFTPATDLTAVTAGVFAPMHDFLSHLAMKGWQRRKVALIENGTWGPTAAKTMRAMLEGMKEIEIIEPQVTIRSRMKESDLPAFEALAEAIIK